MSAFTTAVITALKGDATLQANMGSYGGASAWFSITPTPGDATRPLGVVTRQSTVPFETKSDTDGVSITYDIDVFVDAGGSIATLETITERVRALFHRNTVTVSGYDHVRTEVDGPFETSTDHTAYGMGVSVELTYQKT